MNKNNIDFAGSYVALGKCIGKTKYIVFGKEYTEKEVKSIFEKATQKAPSLYQDYYLEKEFWECPTCGSFLCENGEEYRRGEYCEDCGQRIDWRGEE